MKNALFLTALGIGVVFTFLAVNYVLVLLIGFFRERLEEESDCAVSQFETEISSERAAGDNHNVSRTYPVRTYGADVDSSTHEDEEELIAAAISAIHAYEMEWVQGDYINNPIFRI